MLVAALAYEFVMAALGVLTVGLIGRSKNRTPNRTGPWWLIPVCIVMFVGPAFVFWGATGSLPIGANVTFGAHPDAYRQLLVSDYIGGGLTAYAVGATLWNLYRNAKNNVHFPVWIVAAWALVPPAFFIVQMFSVVSPAADAIFDPLNPTTNRNGALPEGVDAKDLRQSFLEDRRASNEDYAKLWAAIFGLLAAKFFADSKKDLPPM